MGRRPPGGQHDRGESLVELLVAVVLLGTAVVAIVGALATGIRMSDIHRKQALAGSYARSYAEAIQHGVATDSPGYTACGSGGDYASAYSPPAPYTATVIVTYWVPGSGFVGTCGTDSGVQRVAISVSNAGVTESLAVIIRKPCRSGDDPC